MELFLLASDASIICAARWFTNHRAHHPLHRMPVPISALDNSNSRALPLRALLVLTLMVGSLLTACAPLSSRSANTMPQAQTPSPGRAQAEARITADAADSATNQNSELIVRSLGLLGIDYKWGGNTPEEGMDCSGFVRYVFRDALGLNLPRRSEEISAFGDPVERDRLIPGDLVFFNTMRRPFSHVGLYIGNQQFIHAPSTGNVIRVESIRVNYWARRYDSARRITAANTSAGLDNDGLQRLIASRSAVVVSVHDTKAPKPKAAANSANPIGNQPTVSPSYMNYRAALGSYLNH